MNGITRLSAAAAVLTLLFVFCPSCAPEVEEPALPEPVESAQTGSSESETAAETEPPEPLFKSDLEARKAVLAALELPVAAVYYTEESLAAYTEYAAKLNAEILTVTAENAEERIAEIDALIKSMTYRVDADHYMTPEGVLYERGEITRLYVDNPYKIVHRDHYIPMSVNVVYPRGYGKGVSFTAPCSMTMRGNSTRVNEKPPYNLLFEEKKAVAGMDKGKRWVLLANLFDKTQLRNKLAFDFCGNLRFDFSPEAEFVEFYMNGEYRGLYLLCEPVTDGKQRVDIDVENGDCLLELDSVRTEGGAGYITTQSDVRLKINKPEENHTADRNAWTKRLNEIELAMKRGKIEEMEGFVDIESFVDFYIFKEYFKDVDAYYNSTRFYLKDGILYAGPAWDLDLSCGNASDTYGEVKYQSYCNVNGYGTGTGDSADGEWNDFGWFRILWHSNEFKALVLERWKELRPLCENIFRDNELGQNRIDALTDAYLPYIRRNYAEGGWDMKTVYCPYEHAPVGTYVGEIIFLREWLERRLAVVDSLFGYEPSGRE